MVEMYPRIEPQVENMYIQLHSQLLPICDVGKILGTHGDTVRTGLKCNGVFRRERGQAIVLTKQNDMSISEML